MNRVLIDTNAYSAFMSGDKDVLHAISDADIVYMSIFVIGELLFGFMNGKRENDNRRLLDKFLSKSTIRIISATKDTSEFFASIKNNLHKKGNPIPINDIWIAAHCMETGSLLITYDKHFSKIPGLLLWYY